MDVMLHEWNEATWCEQTPIPCLAHDDEPTPRRSLASVDPNRCSIWGAETFTTFLGAMGNFDYWGSPHNGKVIGVGCNGCTSYYFGSRESWRAKVTRIRNHGLLTSAGRSWDNGSNLSVVVKGRIVIARGHDENQ